MSGGSLHCCMPLLSETNVWSFYSSTGPAKSWVKIFWGISSLSGTMIVLAPPGAVPAVGGVLVPLGTAVPWGDSPKVQGGPWAPPPCCENSPETLYAWCLFCLFGVPWVFVGFLCGFHGLRG